MVKHIFSIILMIALLLSACAKDKEKPVQPARDGSFADTQQRSGQLFTELDGKEGAAPQSSKPGEQPIPSSSATEVAPNVVVSTTAASPAPKPGEAIVVEIDSFKVFSDTVSPNEAKIQTRNMMRELALEKALPSDVSITGMSTSMYVERNNKFDESTAKSIFMMSSSAGRFLEEKLLKAEPSFDTSTSSLTYRMRYRAKILPLEKTYNPSMSLQVKISNTLLKHGEEFQISVTPNTDGYLYFFDFLSDSSIALVVPNLDLTDNFIKAGQKWEQTVGAIRDPNKEDTIETLYFVFSQDPIAGWEDFKSNRSVDNLVFSAGEESFILFQNWLARSDPKRRVEKMAQIHIFK